MSDSRKEVLQRIREALKAPARQHHGHAQAATDHQAHEVRDWLPKVGATFEEQAELFAKNAVELKAEFHLVENEAAARNKLREIAEVEAWSQIAVHSAPLTDALLRDSKTPLFWVEPGYSVDELERSPVGITECDALIAQTGSVLITSRSAGGRALSILPPHHVVLARREQMAPDLTAAYEIVRRKYTPHFPSLISFITGPSRTGDIERILVLGAHGPKRLTILVW